MQATAAAISEGIWTFSLRRSSLNRMRDRGSTNSASLNGDGKRPAHRHALRVDVGGILGISSNHHCGHCLVAVPHQVDRRPLLHQIGAEVRRPDQIAFSPFPRSMALCSRSCTMVRPVINIVRMRTMVAISPSTLTLTLSVPDRTRRPDVPPRPPSAPCTYRAGSRSAGRRGPAQTA